MNHIRSIVIGLLVSIICQWIISSSAARCAGMETDLYRVYIDSRKDAHLLASLPVDPLWRLSDGYLVLVSQRVTGVLNSAGLRHELVVSGVERNELALDMRHDRSNVGKYPLIFEDGGLRIFRSPSSGFLKTASETGLAPIRTENIPIVYRPPARLDYTAPVNPADLDSLIDKILIDSLIAYSDELQAFNGRWVGSYGNLMSAYWCRDKFIELGYDSVVVDTFKEMVDGDWRVLRNIIAYKIGTEFPYHHIVIGAHRDSEFGSPGADDNGSGMAAVFEIARALRTVDTRATVVFALFDAEEEGYLGSFHYATEAYQRGDRIPLMLNIDMISYYENQNDAYVCFESGSESYAQLWIDLADSLPFIGITGHFLEGFGSSDHVSFQQYGYNAIFSFEYTLSTVMHTPHDSTTYMNFDYMTRMVKASLATIYTVDQQFVPDHEILFACPEPLPELLPPDEPTSIGLSILPYGGAEVLPGSVYLHYTINDEPSDSLPMTDVGNGQFIGSLPTPGCFNEVAYQISARDDSLGTIYYPDDPIGAFVAVGMETLFEDDFHQDLGWEVSGDAASGQWERCEVNGGAATPDSDVDGNNMCYVTDCAMNSDVDDGTVTLISPAIDASAGNVILRYARWYSNDYPFFNQDPNNDTFNVFISNDDGASWVPLETVGPVEQASGGWYRVQFLLDNIITPTDRMRLRFDASDLGLESRIEAAVDAVQFLSLSAGPVMMTADMPDWTVNIPYEQQLEAGICEGLLTWTDKYGQLDGTGLSLTPDGLVSGLPNSPATIIFTAKVEGTGGSSAEHLFSFVINSALQITTSMIGNGTTGQSYTCHLYTTGGTGTKTWSDRDGDLDGTGVTLSGSGLLSGTPAVEGDFPFTAFVTDQVGAAGEKTFTLHVVGPYVCGDADGDGMVNVGDAVNIINYIFKGGAPPDPIEAGDANADGAVNVADAVYLINFIFKGGPAPECP